MAKPDIEVSDKHWAIVRQILQQYLPEYRVCAFGSRAKKSAKPYSDLDLAVYNKKLLPLRTKALLEQAFSESDLPWKVDVVEWCELDAGFKEIICQDAIVVQDK